MSEGDHKKIVPDMATEQNKLVYKTTQQQQQHTDKKIIGYDFELFIAQSDPSTADVTKSVTKVLEYIKEKYKSEPCELVHYKKKIQWGVLESKYHDLNNEHDKGTSFILWKSDNDVRGYIEKNNLNKLVLQSAPRNTIPLAHSIVFVSSNSPHIVMAKQLKGISIQTLAKQINLHKKEAGLSHDAKYIFTPAGGYDVISRLNEIHSEIKVEVEFTDETEVLASQDRKRFFAEQPASRGRTFNELLSRLLGLSPQMKYSGTLKIEVIEDAKRLAKEFVGQEADEELCGIVKRIIFKGKNRHGQPIAIAYPDPAVLAERCDVTIDQQNTNEEKFLAEIHATSAGVHPVLREKFRRD